MKSFVFSVLIAALGAVLLTSAIMCVKDASASSLTSEQASALSAAAVAQSGAVSVVYDSAVFLKTSAGFLSYKNYITPRTASFSAASFATGTWFTNTGASGSITGTLPVCTASKVGTVYGFRVDAAFAMLVASSSPDVINVPGLAQTTKTIITSPTTASAGALFHCYATGKWATVFQQTGTWTSN